LARQQHGRKIAIVTKVSSVDVVVTGAGAAGMAAAIAAARQGAEVLLFEKHGASGGTVVHGLIHTLGGLYDDEGGYLNPGLPLELAERLLKADRSTRPRKIGKIWTLSVEPGIYGRVTADWLVEAGVRVLSGTAVTRVQATGGRIEALELRDQAGDVRHVHGGVVIDCSGSAEVVRLADPERVVEEEDRAAAGLIFQVGHVDPDALVFPRNIEILRGLRRAAEQGRLPEACVNAWVDVGVKEQEAYVKLFVPMAAQWRQPAELERATAMARSWRDAVLAHLKTLPGFGAATLGLTGDIGIRDGGRIVGDYLLTVEDVRNARIFPDAACRCNWPIEYWHPQTGVQLEYLPAGRYYEIPLRALRVKGYANLWAAGKCLSAEPRARASARVVGCCWGMGEAAGIRAAQARKGQA
jgi:hypothetical protein